MAGHRFGRADGEAVFRVFTEDSLDRASFANVAQSGGSGMGVDVIHFSRRDSRVIKRHLRCPSRALAIGRWRSHVVSVAGKSVSGELAIDFSATGPGMFEF